MSKGPLILTKSDITAIHNVLSTLLRQSDAKCALVVNQDGKCVAQRGFTQNIDTTALAALIAGSFSSTRAMAELLGEKDFTVLFHQGEKDHIHNNLIDNSNILTVIFDDRTTIGMVRLYTREAAQQLREMLDRAGKKRLKTPDQQLDVSREAEDRIEDLFKES
ncbi:MAG: roadblock/LC7 domain-containing protein [Candidatus Sumerlaeia bacterium]